MYSDDLRWRIVSKLDAKISQSTANEINFAWTCFMLRLVNGIMVRPSRNMVVMVYIGYIGKLDY